VLRWLMMKRTAEAKTHSFILSTRKSILTKLWGPPPREFFFWSSKPLHRPNRIITQALWEPDHVRKTDCNKYFYKIETMCFASD
jgi:hypothetical protein